MQTAIDLVAREVGQHRRAVAQQRAREAAVRLACRDRRLHRRLARVEGQLVGMHHR